MKEIIAHNLTRYRKGLHLSMERLARQVGLTRQTIHNYEKARTLPDSRVLADLADALGVAPDDLLREETGLPDFRFRAHTSFEKQPQLAAKAVRMLEDYTALEEAVGVPPYAPESTPCSQLEGSESRIEEVARQFRNRLGFGEAPIANLFEAAEELGLKVMRTALPAGGIAGLSACSLERGAFVMVNTHDIAIERQIFALAHEIGHLIFHRGDYTATLLEGGVTGNEKAHEEVADYFAGHLLVPQGVLEREMEVTNSLVRLKAYFRVGYEVILTRLAQMGKLDYNKATKQIRYRYRKLTGHSLSEGAEIDPQLSPVEFPENRRFRRLVREALEAGSVTELRAAELLDLTVAELRRYRKEAEADVILL